MAGVQPAATAGSGWLASHHVLTRPGVAWAAGTAGLLVYNWWVLVPLRPGLWRSPNELFSNLEVSGRPFATAMQHADVISGLLLLAAFLAVGAASIRGAQREWLAMLVFAAAGALGGLLPETCADQVSVACRDRELSLQLPLQQYVHAAAGICEFAAITVALVFAFQRTRGARTGSARVYRALITGAVVAYPLLGLAYLVNRLGGVMEVVFFMGFTVMVLTQLAERTAACHHRASQGQRARPLIRSGAARGRSR